MQRTRKRKSITSRLVNYLRRASSRLHSVQSTLSTNADIFDEAGSQAAEFDPVLSLSYDLEPCVLCASEIYHSTGGCDTFSEHKYASVADLCSHLGRRIPIKLVKLVARDTLKALKDYHQSRDRPYRDISKQTIQLSHTDLTSIVVHLRADSQPSFTSSQFSVHFPFHHQEDQHMVDGEVESLFYSPPPSTNAPVFSLFVSSDTDEPMQLPGSIAEQKALRPPEALLGAPCQKRADMWVLGCLLFELLTGEALFDPIFQTAELNISEEESHLIQMIELLGEMPKNLISTGNSSEKWFTKDGLLRIETTYYPTTLASVLEGHIEKSGLRETTEFLERFLRLLPEDRANPEDMIDHQWFSS